MKIAKSSFRYIVILIALLLTQSVGNAQIINDPLNESTSGTQKDNIFTNFLDILPSSKSVSSSLGNTTFDISSNLTWKISDDAEWLSVSPGSGSNSLTITASYDENTTSSPRTGIITVIGSGITRTVTIVQDGKTDSNYLDVYPSSQSVSSDLGDTTFSVSSDMSWTVSDDAGWLSVSPNSGSGSGTLTASFNSNNSSDPRTGTIVVTGNGITRTVTVIQAGQNNNPSLTVSPANHDVQNSSGSVNFTIESNLIWSVKEDAEWLSKNVESGSKNATLSVTYEENPTASQRIATITVTGGGINRNVTVTQEGSPSYLLVSPSSKTVGDTSGSVNFAISSNDNWEITENADWLTVSPTNGSGSSNFSVTFLENTSSTQRSAEITITAGNLTKTATLVQDGAPVFTLDATPNPETSASITGTGSYTYNSEVTIVCTPNDGWKFDNWKEDGTIVSTDSAYTFNLTSDRTLVAELSVLNNLFGFGEMPTDYKLLNNFPNPFNPTTQIGYMLPKESFVELAVYNLLGEKIVSLVKEYKSAGTYSVEFNADNLPSGTYIYTMKAGKFSQTKKLVLLK